MEYLFTSLNRLSIVASDFFVRDSKNDVPEKMFHLKIYKMASMLQDSTFSRYLSGFNNFLVLTLILPFFRTGLDSFSALARIPPFAGSRTDSTIFWRSH